jgi:hypothetical protein
MGRWLAALVTALVGTSSFLCPASEAAEPPLNVPILLYHRLGPVLTDDMTVTTPVVESQLKLIQERGYRSFPCASCWKPTTSPKRRRRNVPWWWSPMTAIAASTPTSSR